MLLLAIGFLSASLSSMLGVGGGALMVPLIIFCTGFDQKQAVTLCLGSLIIPFLFALYRNPATTTVPLGTYAIITIGGCGGAIIGTYLSGILPADLLKKGVAILLLIAAFQLFQE
jgi:uncharacterized membrane protein YfcA